MSIITYKQIGIIHTPFKKVEGMPIQPASANTAEGKIEVFKEYSMELQDLEGFSHIILLYHLHQAGSTRLKVIPFLDHQERGVFATRSLVRPNIRYRY